MHVVDRESAGDGDGDGDGDGNTASKETDEDGDEEGEGSGGQGGGKQFRSGQRRGFAVSQCMLVLFTARQPYATRTARA